MKKFLVLAVVALSVNANAQSLGLLGTNFAAPTVVDKDSIYNPAAGEIIYDATAGEFYGRTHTNIWKELSGSGSGNAMPVGSILTTASANCPAGYLPADGAAVSREDYSALFTEIGITHGQGNGSSTFNVPDYRGRFLRGVSGGSANDPDRASRAAMATGGNTGNAVGSVQASQLGSHAHGIANTSNRGNLGAWNSNGGRVIDGSGAASDYVAGGTISTTSSGGNETRPVNAYVNYCIKS